MASYETASGLLVHDRRALQRVYDRDDVPNPNPPIGTVGPHTPAGEVMDFTPLPVVPTTAITPPGAQAWSGWPDGWTVPWSNLAGWASIAAASSIVWLCVDKNTSILASMPPYLTRNGDTLAGGPAWLTNPQPEVYAGWGEFLREVFACWWLQGEAFIWATSSYATNKPRTFVMLNPSWVTLDRDGGRRVIRLGGADITDEVLHLRYATWPGELHGIGPVQAAYSPLRTTAAVEQLVEQLAISGGAPWAVLRHPATLTAKQSAELRAAYVQSRLEARYRGEGGAPLILSGGLDLQPLTVNVRDLALLEVLKLSESRIAHLFSMPPALVGLPTGQDSLTYNNGTQFRLDHWRIDLRPKAALVMEAFSGWLLPRGTALELNRDEYLAPEFTEEVQALSVLHAIQDNVTGERAITVPEIRAILRLGEPQGGPDVVDAALGLSDAEVASDA